jgi:ferredoxin
MRVLPVEKRKHATRWNWATGSTPPAKRRLPADAPATKLRVELQRLSIRYGAGSTEFAGDTGQFELFDGSPILQLDRKRCIKCHTCIRVCDEVEAWACTRWATPSIRG